jgi:hypothetical protein
MGGATVRRTRARRSRGWWAVFARVSVAAGAVGASVLFWTSGGTWADAGTSVTPAGCGSNTAGTTLAGTTATLESLGAQVSFALAPGLLPLSGNLVEDDLSFTRTSINNGPQMTVQAAPWYPGDIAANAGSLASAFGVPFPIPNDPLQAFASYPPSPLEPSDSTFPPAVAIPSSLLVKPSVASAQAHAGPDKSNRNAVDATAVSALTGLDFGAAPHLPVSLGTVQSTNAAIPGSSCLTASATATVRAINLAGLVSIASISSVASAQSDGTTGQPTATLQVGQVTVDGMSAFIDNKGIHFPGSNAPSNGFTPQQMQVIVDNTLSQDGISVRLLDPTTTTNGAEASANSGALVITLSHAIDIPYVPGEPTIPIPGLGNEGLPSGVYQATTAITLGSTVVDVNAAALPSTDSGSGNTGNTGTGVTSTTPVTAPTGFGIGTLGGVTNVSVPSGPGVAATPPAAAPTSSGLVRHLLGFHIPGIPSVPGGWIVLGVIACVLFTYLMLMVAWAQLLKGRK